jgi:uncharacterized protein YjiK
MRPFKLISLYLLMPLFLLALFVSCRQRVQKLKSPPHYNFAEPYEIKLDLRLKEVSGITWDSKANVFYAISDESNLLFVLDKELRSVIGTPQKFGDLGDYEDVAIYRDNIYILRSDGMLTKLAIDSTGKSHGIEAGKISLSGTNDFETLYPDTLRKALILICKNCKTDDRETISAYAFYPDSIGFDNKPIFRIDDKAVQKLSPFKSSKFQPSAAAIHPIMKKLFIISSASNQLVIADLNGEVLSVHKLSPKLFPQPEGITFKQNGNMYISSEGIGAKAKILQFNYKDTTSTKKVAGIPYNFSAPDDTMELGSHLKEISGMSYVAKTKLILTENDEKGDIFAIDFANKRDKVEKIKFGGKGDYEDIVYTDSAIYMLVSEGKIVKVPKDSSFSTTEYDLGLGKSEFEAMYLDSENKSLILLCKECAHEKDEVREAYRFDLTTNTFEPGTLYTIQISEIQKLLNDSKAEFKPSAAALHPVTGKLFIVASVGKVLVVATPDGKIENVFQLDPLIYNQPEGMTFAPNGDLYISNEGGEGIARIYRFNFSFPKK